MLYDIKQIQLKKDNRNSIVYLKRSRKYICIKLRKIEVNKNTKPKYSE